MARFRVHFKLAIDIDAVDQVEAEADALQVLMTTQQLGNAELNYVSIRDSEPLDE